MKILEFDQESIQTGYYDPSKDEINTYHLDDTRKPVLTLAALNRLKRMRALRKLETLKRQDLLQVMYSSPDEGAGPGGMPGF
jgi:hypothetical protein